MADGDDFGILLGSRGIVNAAGLSYCLASMCAPRVIRRTAIVAAALVVSLFPCLAVHAFSAGATGAGTLVAWISGLDFLATIRGQIELAGDAALGGEVVPLSAAGTLRGFGVRGIVTLVSEGWIAYEAAGVAFDGEPLEIRGLLHARRETLIPLRSGELIVGSHRVAVRFRGETYRFCGAFAGTIEGGLEPAETWGTIQFGGTGAVQLNDDSGEPSPLIPLDHPALPADFLEYVAGLDLGI